jgi:UDP-N-acetylglucosamine acyltransferase
MATEIHPTAVIEAGAALGDDVVIGPFCVIDGQVSVGDGCVIGPFCRITGHASIGPGNRFESHCSVGAPPQDLKYRGEPTRLEIGANNLFREFATLHRGTPGGGGLTSIGDDGAFLAYSHVGHDSHVGSRVLFSHAASTGGHVAVGDDATVGAYSSVHQFCRVGPHAFIGGFSACTKDVLPFMKTVGARPARCYGPNTIGLERKGFAEERRLALKRLWRHLHNPKLNTSRALDVIRAELGGQQDVDLVLEFIATSKRGVILSRG